MKARKVESRKKQKEESRNDRRKGREERQIKIKEEERTE